MRKILAASLALTFACFGQFPAQADAAIDFGEAARAGDAELPAYIECVPYARSVSGIQLYGDAYTWWQQAAGRFVRGHTPKKGAVMAFQPYGNMPLGHVAAVSEVVDSRTVLLRHANWSPINGRRGQIEDNVRAVDVSPNNDWSEVRVWYAPIGKLGATEWPVEGFIYPDRDKSPARRAAPPALARADQAAPLPSAPARTMLSAPATKSHRDVIGAIIRGEY